MIKCKVVKKHNRVKIQIKPDNQSMIENEKLSENITNSLPDELKSSSYDDITKTMLSFRKIEAFVDDEINYPYISFKERIIADLTHSDIVDKKVNEILLTSQTNNVIYQTHSYLEQVLDSTNNILIILDYELDYNYIQILDYLSTIINNVSILVLNEKSIFLHKFGDRVKILDRDHQVDLSMYKNILIKKIGRCDTVINASEKNSLFMSDIMLMFRNRIQQSYNYIYSILTKKITIFINFRNTTNSYGGGNQFVNAYVSYLKKINNVNIVYDLTDKIDIYLIIGIRKDNKFKRYSMDEIINNKKNNKNNNHGKIICRINDCDFTRKIRTIETGFIQYLNDFDLLIYNSYFIKRYYESKYDEFVNKKNKVIHNSCDSAIFFPKTKHSNKKIRIVTHHWSDNVNKGYYYYKKFAQYCLNNTDYEFSFIGRKFNDKFDINGVNCIHEMSGMELSNELRKYDVYLSASIYDACPMHVIEGLSCGLPILYIDIEGGGRELCQLTLDKVGESFLNFDELLSKLDIIKNNYDYYYQNILKNTKLYNSNKCYSDYFINGLNIL